MAQGPTPNAQYEGATVEYPDGITKLNGAKRIVLSTELKAGDTLLGDAPGYDSQAWTPLTDADAVSAESGI